ncbi:MAG: Hsp70 family protein, partial [Gemmataceae bacterium]
FGMEEGTDATVPGVELSLVVGEPVRFRFFAGANRKTDKPGDWLEEWEQELEELTPLETALRSQKPAGTLQPVHMRATMTEVGTLELHCQSTDQTESWRLEFEARQ